MTTTPKTIVIADAMEREVVEKLKSLGEVMLQPSDLKAALKTADALIVRSATKVTADLIADAPRLKIVARAGVGLDNVDKPACEAKGIKVINTPDASTNAVAELAVGNMIALLRKVAYAHAKMKAGVWDKKNCTGTEIAGKTLGLVGFGRIGQSVRNKAEALGMNVVYHARHPVSGVRERYYASLDEMLPHCDVLSMHANSQAGMPPLLGAAQFSKMKKGAYIVNSSRGALIDEAALIEALRSGQVGGAALDVFLKEPKGADPLAGAILELAKLDNVLLTPHIGAGTIEAQARIGEELVIKLGELMKN